jgi:hypothetical protein
MGDDDERGVVSYTGFSASAAAATVITTEESRNLSHLLGELLDSTDEEEEKQHGGSRPGRAPNIKRDFVGANERLVRQYFSGPDSQYTAEQFKRRYRVSPAIFERVYNALVGKGTFLPEGSTDCLGNPCVYPLVRLTAVFRTLAYGSSGDCQDENLQCSESVVEDALHSFCKLLIANFGKEYLNRTPNQEERRRILRRNDQRGFPGCFASCLGL